ncbi:hypothetical protein H6CHR_03929 [Variovorax sp. PBL-H6]|nr:hypothetical protein H6CHR_03929 [Variovorax sp. PBL-H6]
MGAGYVQTSAEAGYFDPGKRDGAGGFVLIAIPQTAP